MKVIDESKVYNEARGNPMSFHSVVHHPIREVLSGPTPVVYSEQSLDMRDKATVDHHRRWKAREARDHGTLLDRLDLADMEGGVNPKGSKGGKDGQLQARRSWQ